MIFVIIALITAIDAGVLYVVLRAMLPEQPITPPPDIPDCFKHAGIANVVSLGVRLAGFRTPIHYLYFGNLFWNTYGLNSVAVFLCMVAMAIPEIALFVLLGGMLQ